MPLYSGKGKGVIQMSKKRRHFSISIPFGPIAAFGIFIYIIRENIWSLLDNNLRILVVIGLILLFLLGDIEYSRGETD